MFRPVWRGVDGMYGGYVVARVVEAAQVVDGFDLMSVSMQFMGAVRDVEGHWNIDVIHRGGSTAAVGVELVQGHPRLTATAKFAAVSHERIIDFPLDLGDLPDPESVPRHVFSVGPLAYETFLDHRLIDDTAARRRRTTRAWIRFTEADEQAPELGPYGVATILLDAQPPGLFFGEPAPIYVPTVDFTVHFAPGVQIDRHGWHYVTQNTIWSTRDFCVEESALYNRSGALIAQARQTRRVVWAD